jgi:hypothetical protein
MKLSKALLVAALISTLAVVPAVIFRAFEAQASPQSGTRPVPKGKEKEKKKEEEKEKKCRTVTRSEVCGSTRKCVYTDLDGDGKAEENCFDVPKICNVKETICE